MSEDVLLKAENIHKKFTDEFGYVIELLKGISFEIKSGKISSIIAPTGSGKTTLLKIVSGLVNADEGNINSDKKIVYIQSKPASFPWFDVTENIKFVNSKITQDELKDLISFVGLEGYEKHRPDNRSAGFRFRILLAQAISLKPEIIVLDEPFNLMQQSSKVEIYTLIRKVCAEKDISILLGTTNITEALYLSDKIYLMKRRPGEIIDEMEINFPEPRNLKIFTDENLINYRRIIEKIFRQKQPDEMFNFII